MAHFAGASTQNFGGATPTGNFVAEIYSQKVLNFFRRKSVVEGITNNDYFGEIASYGDSVKVIKEPTISISDYSRHQALTSQTLEDNSITLVLDQAKYFQFEVEDIESAISHINWMPLATESAAYSLKNSFDKAILDYMAAGAHADNQLNDQQEANVIDCSTPDALLNTISTLGTRLTRKDVPEENRYLVLSPEAWEVLLKAESKLINADFNGGSHDLSNGQAMTAKLRGFTVYVTNNAPQYTSTGTGATTRDILMAGHMSAVATVSAILDTEVLRSQVTFADIVRGKHVYGRAIIRNEALSVAHVKYVA